MKDALIVDNSELMRMVIKDLLEENEIKSVGEAKNVAEAIDAYQRQQPDLVTLDIMMPGGSGIDVLKSIMAKNPKAKVLVITESGRDGVERQLLRQGACAVIHKPLTSSSMKKGLQAAAGGGAAGPEHAFSPRVLIVDDSSVIRTMLKDIVAARGWEVVGEAADVAPAIDSFQKLLPDLVFLDLVMPGGEGTQILRHIMSNKSKTKVLIVSSLAQTKLTEELIQGGAAGVIAKPFTEEEINAALSKMYPAASERGKEGKEGKEFSAEQRDALERLFISSGESCAQAMTKMSKAPWTPIKTQLLAATSAEFLSLADRGHRMQVIPVQITVKKTIMIVGLVMMSKNAAEQITRAVTKNAAPTLDGELVKSMMLEWTNILVTAVVNAFANQLGKVIVSSSPRILDWPVKDLITRVPRELSDNPERVMAAYNTFSCKSLEADCETLFIFRTDNSPLVAQ
ncbi:MAG TPA: hypothetical protein DCZ01_06140 [Elusimicrobia bacterium]|nr:MAG: hypothetical protein A2X37_10900 [Elusimicrobia bacterium GWA2_66_18]OGR71041.1 MAG: hypothetical protein A2X40_11060 [Elusimicrobia bacterium GWC2_65_9]HAZ08094.1 hypothetical protein [Elusimicrobiota bacterium]